MPFGLRILFRKLDTFIHVSNQQGNWKKTRPFRVKGSRIYWRGLPIDDDDFQRSPRAVAEYQAFMKKHGNKILKRLNKRRKGKTVYRRRKGKTRYRKRR